MNSIDVMLALDIIIYLFCNKTKVDVIRVIIPKLKHKGYLSCDTIIIPMRNLPFILIHFFFFKCIRN